MIRKILSIAAAGLILAACNPEVREARGLARRVMGTRASAVVFEQIPSASGADIYEFETVRGKVHVRGNNAGAMAVGLNRYLQQYCLTNVSWYAFNKVELPAELPAVPEKVGGEARLQYRFFLNYCTFGYTMPWWGWEEWERFIDWMALNGVNAPLAITGQEAVWQKVWRRYGMTDEQIRAYFVGPAHLPWQRMCNLDRWQGPLPQGWIDGQAELQKKIVKRERALSMKPILPAFAGHVPQDLETIRPESKTYRVSYWGGFANEYRCTFLDPRDPLYAEIQKAFLEEQTKLYGTDHIYGVDPFNEVDAPFWDPETLASISSGIYESMTAVDPDATWLQMGWLFYADSIHWTDENIEAYLTAVPKGRMIILDYYCDFTQIWKRTKSFYGQPFIWCYLGNFGGMTGIEGAFAANGREIDEAFANAGDGFVGIGSTLEGFGVNEPVYEYILSKAWSGGLSDYDYVDNVADRHYGAVNEDFRAAWHQLEDNVLRNHPVSESSSIMLGHPCLDNIWHWTTKTYRGYQYPELEKAYALMEAAAGSSNYYNYDMVNLRRQCIANSALAVRDAYTAAYRGQNRAGMDAAESKMLALFDEMDALLSTREEFSLDRWIADARSWAVSPGEEAYYEINARTLISVWGDSFHLADYANRDWAGMMSTYYKVRWQMFFDAVRAAMAAGQKFENAHSTGYVGATPAGTDPSVKGPAAQLDLDIWDFECDWALNSAK